MTIRAVQQFQLRTVLNSEAQALEILRLMKEAGANALGLMQRLGTRMKLYHINDRGTRVAGPTMTPILKSDSMELGFGNMDLIPLVEQAKAVGVDAVILESHRNWAGKSPIKSFQLSAAFLNKHV